MLQLTDRLRIIAFLKQLGCNSQESLAYMEALKTGVISVQELSRRLKRNRITVYYTVQQLIKKGLLFETRKGKKCFIAAENPDILSRLIHQRHDTLNLMEKQVEYITQLLNSLYTTQHELTFVKVYDEIDGFKKMLEETLQAKNELLVFSTMAFFSKILGTEYFENYFHRRAEEGIHTRIIYPPCSFADSVHAKRDKYRVSLRLLSQDQSTISGFYVWNENVALKSIKGDKATCMIISNKEISDFFRHNIFEHFWEEAQPYESDAYNPTGVRR